MIVTVLSQKYRCGCGKGIFSIPYTGLIEALNEYIDWEKCSWPEKEPGVEDKEFLGTPPQLKPGDCILWDGNVITFDDMDTAILILSETGPLSLKRFIEMLKNEIKLFEDTKKVDIKENKNLNKPENVDCFRLGYDMWSVLKDKYKPKTEVCLSVLDEETLIFPITVWVDRQSIWFDPEEIEKEVIEELSLSIYNYLINSFEKEKEENGN